jgi:IS605 OrfB family transposase
MARAVNFVWNYCNDAQKHEVAWNKRWLSGFDLNNLTAGSSKELKLHSGTVHAVCEQYAKSRSQNKKPWLKYRSKRSLGWVPLKGCDFKVVGKDFVFLSYTFKVFNSRPIPEGAKVRDGTTFARDSRGRWFLNVVFEVEEAPKKLGDKAVGIDLGLKTFAAFSTGEKVENPKILASYAIKLATAQRANKTRQASKIYSRIRSTRQDFHHKLSTRLAKEFDSIYVGNVNASKLAKTTMAKSVFDAGWSAFRSMLAYKSIRNGATYLEVDEKFSTQTCAVCGCLTGPKGLAGLNKREWVCGECGSVHDRDINSAKNILALGCGRATLVEGILGLHDKKDVNTDVVPKSLLFVRS